VEWKKSLFSTTQHQYDTTRQSRFSNSTVGKLGMAWGQVFTRNTMTKSERQMFRHKLQYAR